MPRHRTVLLAVSIVLSSATLVTAQIWYVYRVPAARSTASILPRISEVADVPVNLNADAGNVNTAPPTEAANPPASSVDVNAPPTPTVKPANANSGSSKPPTTTPKTNSTTDSSAVYHSVMTTLFWVGEGASSENGYISNAQSAWDENWGTHFGGVDDPDDRCGYRPCAFTPKENAFYVALPYSDLDNNGNRRSNASGIPWFATYQSRKSVVKNRWLEMVYGSKTCYGQWEDVGPYEENDFAYVFGTATPKNTHDAKAGLDVSPAVWDCLGLPDNVVVRWRFVDDGAVPSGPWRTTVTTSDVQW